MTETRNASPDTLGGGLKPCPICGKPAQRNGRGKGGGVVCAQMTHRIQAYGNTTADADAVWNTRADLTPPINDSGEGGPVAWRYRYPNDEAWQLTQDHDQAFKNTGEVEPLGVIPFAAPSPKRKTDGDAVTELLHRAGQQIQLGKVTGADGGGVMPSNIYVIAAQLVTHLCAALSNPAQAREAL